MQCVLYPYDVISTPEILSRYSKVVEQLRTGRFKQMEKLQGSNGRYILSIMLDSEEHQVDVSGTMNSIRTSQASRILLTPIVIRDKPSFLLLDMMETHKYGASPFSFEKSTVGQSYFALSQEKLTSASFQEMKQEEKPDFTDLKETTEQVSFFGGHFLLLDEEQKPYQFPLVLNGMAGSGKTSAQFRLLIEYTKQLPKYNFESWSTESYLPAVYVARSRRLVRYMEQEFYGQMTKHLPPNTIRFRTIEELLRDTYPDDFWYQDQNKKNIEKGIVSKEYFQNWLEEYRRHARKSIVVQESKNEVVLPERMTALEIYEELRIICGMGQTDYLQLAEEESLVDATQRNILWKFAHTYFAYLAETNKIDIDLFHPKEIKSCYYLVAADESHNFSHAQLKFLYSLPQKNRIFFAFDDHQNFYNPYSKWIYLMKLVGHHVTHLPATYRNPYQVNKLAERILRLNHFLANGIPHKNATTKVKISEENLTSEEYVKTESVIWHSGDISEVVTERELESEQCVVLVENEDKIKGARLAFGENAHILTVHDSQGLEFHTVLCYHFFTKDSYSGMNKVLQETPFEEEKVSHHRAKNKNYRLDFITRLNQLGIAVTRVTKKGKLILLIDKNENQHAIANVVNTLQAVTITMADLHHASPTPEATKKGLEELAANLSEGGTRESREAADRIRNHLAMKSHAVMTPIIPDKKLELSLTAHKKLVTQLVENATVDNICFYFNHEYVWAIFFKKVNEKQRQCAFLELTALHTANFLLALQQDAISSKEQGKKSFCERVTSDLLETMGMIGPSSFCNIFMLKGIFTILEELFKQNSLLATSISLSALFEKDKLTNSVSTLEILAIKGEAGSKMLATFFDGRLDGYQPKLLLALKKCGFMLFKELFQSSGYEFLVKLLIKNPEWAKEFSAQILLDEKLFVLLTNCLPNNHFILRFLIDHHLTLASDLCDLLNRSENGLIRKVDEEDNCYFFCFLCLTENGQYILSKFMQYVPFEKETTFLHNIFIMVNEGEVKVKRGDDNSSLADCLCLLSESLTGQAILRRMGEIAVNKFGENRFEKYILAQKISSKNTIKKIIQSGLNSSNDELYLRRSIALGLGLSILLEAESDGSCLFIKLIQSKNPLLSRVFLSKRSDCADIIGGALHVKIKEDHLTKVYQIPDYPQGVTPLQMLSLHTPNLLHALISCNSQVRLMLTTDNLIRPFGKDNKTVLGCAGALILPELFKDQLITTTPLEENKEINSVSTPSILKDVADFLLNQLPWHETKSIILTLNRISAGQVTIARLYEANPDLKVKFETERMKVIAQLKPESKSIPAPLSIFNQSKLIPSLVDYPVNKSTLDLSR